MGSYSSEVTLATRVLCAAGGALRLEQLHRALEQECGPVSEQELGFILEHCPRFALLPGPTQDGLGLGQDCVVVARTSLRLCRKYLSGDCEGCQDLHLCRYFLYGNCKYSPARTSCRFSHNINSDHNSPILRECTLHKLNQDELFQLLLQNDSTLLPEVCLHYNKGLQQHGNCNFQENCSKVHLCLHFLQGLCLFGQKCMRQHTVDETGRRMLEGRGLSTSLIHKLPSLYQNCYRLKLASEDNTLHSPQSETVYNSDICLHFLRNSCKFQENCELVHFHLPYRWQVCSGSSWVDLNGMERIEEAYCDPSNTQSFGLEPINFLTMTLGALPVRRLSTVSSVKRPLHYTLTTQWLWYYKGDHEKWVQYGQPDDKKRTTSVTSRHLEEAFLSNKTEVLLVKDMYQRNPKHNTKRRVCRRPRFVSPPEVKRLANQ